MTGQPSTGQLSALYPLVMLTALASGAWLSRCYKSNLRLLPSQKIWIGLFAFCGAMLAAKLPFMMGLPGFQGEKGVLISGKTILYGLVGGYAGVEVAKWSIGVRTKTGDTFVVPVAVSIGIGRLACFCGGCCYGLPTSWPWGVRFPHIDQQLRHPTQLYESIFHLSMGAVCAVLYQRKVFRRQLIKFYFISYFVFRFLTEFVRPEAHVAQGMTIYQWTCLFLIPVFGWLWYRDRSRGGNLVPGATGAY